MKQNQLHWCGKKYSCISQPQFRINNIFLNEQHFPENSQVLDVGCGTGETTLEIEKRIPFGKILGIDISESMIESARKHPNLGRTQFKISNAEDIRYKNKFNLATSFFCMQWVPDKKKAIKLIFEALKEDSKFLMIVPLPHQKLPEIRNELIRAVEWKSYFNHFRDPLRFINDTNYELYLSSAGFQDLNMKIEDYDILFPDKNSFFDFMYEMTPHLKVFNTEILKIKFLNAFINKYLKNYPLEMNNTIKLTYRLLKVSCIRQY